MTSLLRRYLGYCTIKFDIELPRFGIRGGIHWPMAKPPICYEQRPKEREIEGMKRQAQISEFGLCAYRESNKMYFGPLYLVVDIHREIKAETDKET